MRIALSCFGKFHADFLAESLYREGVLAVVFTANPMFCKRIKIDKKYIRCLPLLIVPRLVMKVPILDLLYEGVNWICIEIFDLWVSRQLKNCDLFIGWSSSCLKSIRAAKANGIKTVVMRTSSHILYQKEILEDEYRRLNIKKKPVFDKIIERELKEYEEADYIQIQSKFTLNSFIEKGTSQNKLLHIPSGVSLKDFHFVDKGGDKTKFIVLYVGNISVRKGILYLLEAIKQLKDANIQLLLIGNIEKEFRMILSRYKGYYTHLDSINQKRLKDYFSKASVFVQPSLEEGLSYVIVEAMACKLPVIATINTGADDVLREGKDGFIINIRDSKAIAERLHYLYNNPKAREELASSAVSRAKEFGWDSYGEKAIAAYRDIIKNE